LKVTTRSMAGAECVDVIGLSGASGDGILC